MGSDNLFEKRKKRLAASLKRSRAKRESYDTVLIVCEGEKTEPYYFEDLRDELKLNSANVEITGDTKGSSPITIVDYGLKQFGEYDRIYCVFDKDRHDSYKQALDKIRRQKPSKTCTIKAITSVPCFEFWILLHFRMTTRNFATSSGSICAQVISELKKFIPEYEKGTLGVYLQLKDKLPTAIKNAREVAKYCQQAGTDHPSTQIAELVIYLQNLKKS